MMKRSRFHISLYIIVPFIFAGFSIFSALLSFRITKYSLAHGAEPATWVFWFIVVIGTLAYAAGFAMVRFILQPVEEFLEKASKLPALGAAAAGFLIDIIRLALHLPNAHIFTFAIIAHLVCFILALTVIRREDQVYDADEVVEPARTGPKRNPWQVAGDVLRESIFWRFLVLASLLIFVRAVGLGPLAGIMAIAIVEIGTFIKLYSEAIENLDRTARAFLETFREMTR